MCALRPQEQWQRKHAKGGGLKRTAISGNYLECMTKYGNVSEMWGGGGGVPLPQLFCCLCLSGHKPQGFL